MQAPVAPKQTHVCPAAGDRQRCSPSSPGPDRETRRRTATFPEKVSLPPVSRAGGQPVSLTLTAAAPDLTVPEKVFSSSGAGGRRSASLAQIARSGAAFGLLFDFEGEPLTLVQ